MEKTRKACHEKRTPRDPKTQKDITTRLNRAIGQLKGIQEMIDANRYCGDVLIQLVAAQKAIKKVSEIVLKEHMHTCLIEDIEEGRIDSVDEVIDLISRFS